MFELLSKLGFSTNQTGHLALNQIDLTTLIKDDQPVYVMNELLIRQHIQAYQKGFQQHYPHPTTLFYASKAFLNLAMAALIHQEGVGIDVCSGGELFVAQQGNIPGNRILMHGNNKSQQELRAAVHAELYAIVIDSESEYNMLLGLSGDKIPAIMLRVNPTVTVDTHPALATGVKGSKFGVSIADPQTFDLIKRLSESTFVKFKGLHIHIGSQIFDFQAYTDALHSIFIYIRQLKDQGDIIDHLDIGGGLGVNADEATTAAIDRFTKDISHTIMGLCETHDLSLPSLAIEPGRTIVNQAGCTLYKVGHIKEIDGKNLMAVHGGMSDNMRVALYKAPYQACIANKMGMTAVKHYKIVGNCCESGDVLIEDAFLPECQTGDILAVFNTGAYCHSIANQYNKHPLPGIVFVRDGMYDWVTKPQEFSDLISKDTIPLHFMA